VENWKLLFSSWKSKIYDAQVQNAKIEVQNLRPPFPKKHKKPQINKLKTQDSKLPLPKTHKP
jgi:hypothetical protein